MPSASNLTDYIGQEYPITSYGCSQSVSSSTTQITALSAQQIQLEGAFTQFMSVLTPLLAAKVSAIAAAWHTYALAPGAALSLTTSAGVLPGTVSTHAYGNCYLSPFGNYGVENGSEWEIILEILYTGMANSPIIPGTATGFGIYRPPYTIFDNNTSKPKAMILDYNSSSGWGLLATPSIHNKSGAIFTQDQPLTIKFRFGADMGVKCTETQMFVSDGWTFMPFNKDTGQLGYPVTQVLSPAGAIWDNDTAIVNAMFDVNFVGDHIYGYPSNDGVYGVARKIESFETGQDIMTNTQSKYKSIDSFYRLGNNNAGLVFTDWISLSAASYTYIDQWNLAIAGNVTSQTPSGTVLFYDIDDTGSLPVTGYSHGYNKSVDTDYHTPSMATYCEVILTPDVLSTVNFKSVSASDQFGELLMSDDIVSLQVSGGATYTDLLYVNQLSVRIASVSASQLPIDITSLAPSAQATPIITTHLSGLVAYFNMFKKTNGTDPYAGKTVVRVGEGIPLTPTIRNVYIKGA
jgi:hypothetical protein